MAQQESSADDSIPRTRSGLSLGVWKDVCLARNVRPDVEGRTCKGRRAAARSVWRLVDATADILLTPKQAVD